ncbi:exported hypothetical protein [Candidatus Sulfopaludibacter sp. SbA6]|nr:exported hypothetical protein [Candidatus Sulfopaludibacter sp. SbA6]
MRTRILLTLTILNRSATWAADVEINVKSGLWEVTRTVEVKSGMSAAEKAAKEDLQKKALGAGSGLVSLLDEPLVTKECLTQGQVDGRAYPQGQMQMAKNGCKQVKVKSTSSAREIRYDCPNSGAPVSFTYLFTAPNTETWTASEETVGVDMWRDQTEVARSPLQRVLVRKTSGKWLGPACGDVRE